MTASATYAVRRVSFSRVSGGRASQQLTEDRSVQRESLGPAVLEDDTSTAFEFAVIPVKLQTF